MPGAEPSYRPGTVADAEAVARLVIDGFEEYRSFAPEGWSPPSLAGEVERLGELLPDPDVWCLLAESGGELAGQVTFMPAARHWSAVDDPSLAHLRTLFVRRDFWGTGVATALLAAAVEEARERAYAHMRLFTPAQQRRARRFYEREGWAVAGDEYHDPGPDLVIVEYRRALGGARCSTGSYASSSRSSASTRAAISSRSARTSSTGRPFGSGRSQSR